MPYQAHHVHVHIIIIARFNLLVRFMLRKCVSDVLKESLCLWLVASLLNCLPPAYVVHKLMEPNILGEHRMSRYSHQEQLHLIKESIIVSLSSQDEIWVFSSLFLQLQLSLILSHILQKWTKLGMTVQNSIQTKVVRIRYMFYKIITALKYAVYLYLTTQKMLPLHVPQA